MSFQNARGFAIDGDMILAGQAATLDAEDLVIV